MYSVQMLNYWHIFIVQIINMQETSRQIINHVRIMIEEAEHTNKVIKVS